MVHGFSVERENEDQVQVTKLSYRFVFMMREALEMQYLIW